MTRHPNHIAGRLIAGFAIAGAMAFASFPASADVTPSGTDGVRHFLDCFGVMIHNPAEHAQFCSPGQTLPFQSITTPGGPSYQSPCRAYVLSDAAPDLLTLKPGERLHVAEDCYTGPLLDIAPAE